MANIKTINSKAITYLMAAQDESADLIYVDPPFNTGRKFNDYDDSWPTIKDFLHWIMPHFKHGHRILKDSGNMVIHLDYRAAHYVKVLLDRIFGVENFRNEIIWCYQSGGASQRHLSKKHDVLLWYSKSDNYSFNVIREPYPHDYGGREGFHPEGRMLNDWWQIPILSSTSSERVGYDTEKPPALLERIIHLWSNDGDHVLDFFCGSGVSGQEALRQGRNATLVDVNPRAIQITRSRIQKLLLEDPTLGGLA